MSLLVRKITRSKWPNERTDKLTFSAHAITIDLRAPSSDLSLWEVDNEGSIEEAVIAILTNCDYLTDVDIAILKTDELRELQFDLHKGPGKTGYIPYLDPDKHVDVKNLTYETVGIIAEYMNKRLLEEGGFKRIKSTNVKKIFTKAVRDGNINMESLKDTMKEQISEILEAV